MDEFDRKTYQTRLKILRRYKRMNQLQFAEYVGIGYKIWNHYERGWPLSREAIFQLRKRVELRRFRLDWIYWGDEEALSRETLEQVRLYEEELQKYIAKPNGKVKQQPHVTQPMKSKRQQPHVIPDARKTRQRK
jgi:transcriptional regulator with XRE-family HTH domain